MRDVDLGRPGAFCNASSWGSAATKRGRETMYDA